jgi:hypothetical protein
MATFEIETEEYHAYKVTYSVEAKNRQEAVDKIISYDTDFINREMIEGEDEIIRVRKINGRIIPIAQSNELLKAHIARRLWEYKAA